MKRLRIIQDFSKSPGKQWAVATVQTNPFLVDVDKAGFKDEAAARVYARERMRYEAMHGEAALIGPGIIRLGRKGKECLN